jgi:hypothetical protein
MSRTSSVQWKGVRQLIRHQATALDVGESFVDSLGAREEPRRVSCDAPAPACELATVWRSPEKQCADALSRTHASEGGGTTCSVNGVHNAGSGLGSRCTNGAASLYKVLLCKMPAEARAALHPVRKLSNCLLAQGTRRLHSIRQPSASSSVRSDGERER